MNYVYFYSAQFSLNDKIIVHHGLITSNVKVITDEIFEDVVDLIAAKHPKHRCVVTALNFLHAVEEAETE